MTTDRPGPGQDPAYAMLAHEVRGSAHGALAFLSILLCGTGGPLTEVQIDFLQSVSASIRRIVRLSEDLDVLAADGTIQMQFAWIDLCNHIANCVRETYGLANSHEIRVVLHVPETGPCMLWADPMRIEQIVLNLLENAIRYAPSATTVHLRLRCSPSRVLLTIQNQTVHPNPEDLATLQAPFARGNSSPTQHSRGRGLGLTICRALVTAHQGSLLMRSQRHSVTIAVTLPRRPGLHSATAGMNSAPRPTTQGRPTLGTDQSRHHLEDPAAGQ